MRLISLLTYISFCTIICKCELVNSKIAHNSNVLSTFHGEKLSQLEELLINLSQRVETLEQTIADFETEANDQFTAVKKAISDTNAELPNLPGKWSGDSYCILANGDCPSGFTRYEGYLRAF